MGNTNLKREETAQGCLNYLINLRWVILQYCAVMISKNKRKHFIFEHMSELFESDIFKDYTEKIKIQKTRTMQNWIYYYQESIKD